MTTQASRDDLPRLEKYTLLEEIGHGGMATVYRAIDPRLGREVALKIIHKHLRENSEVSTRFVAEARASAKLKHPNIVEVFDVSDEKDSERYLVVELVRGTTLRKVLQKHRDMPAEVGAAIVLSLCDALEHAHARGIIHRDVKPENVLVELPEDRAKDGATRDSRDGTHVVIKLTDFGIAKILDAQGVTSTGQVLGSPAHMAPEQIEGGEVDVRTDVFALGVLMYECMVGRLPFEGKNPAQVLRKVLDGTYEPADRVRPTVGGRWGMILASALEREASRRMPTPRALADSIRRELLALGEDPEQLVRSYFADPETQKKELPTRLVPRLVRRGELARRQKDVTGAAADFNRALAFSPNDVAILKRLRALNKSQTHRQVARRAVLLLGTVVLTSGVGFAAAKAIRKVDSKPALGERVVPGASSLLPAVVPVASVDTPTLSVLSSASPPENPSAKESPAVALPRSGEHSTPRVRPVRFSLIPMGAKLTVDGVEYDWIGKTIPLVEGLHELRAIVPDSKCCKALTASITIPPASPEDGDRPFSVVKTLELMPSTVSLVGAPRGASFVCPQLDLSGFVGATKTVQLHEAQWAGTCEFLAPNTPQRLVPVTLRAGEPNTLEWPQ